jgi:putative spermidine/putrescine transport system permease protein
VTLVHAALGASFVVVAVTASLASFDSDLARAAAGLGAAPWTVFRSVTLPLTLPGVAAGAVVAFATSFDGLLVVLFIGGVEQRTVPRQMWTGLRDQINPSILVVATLLTVLAVLPFWATAWLRTRTAGRRVAS